MENDAFDPTFEPNVARHRIGGYDFNHHCHPQIKAPRDRSAERTLIIVSLLTIVFIVGEFTGGFLAHSLAVMTDAAHMLSDLLSFLISLIRYLDCKKTCDKKTVFWILPSSILVIWVLTGILVYLAVDRVIKMDFEVHGDAMVITSAAAVLFNIIMGLVLHFGGAGHGHSHFGGGHGHSHGENHNHSHSNGHEHSHSNSPPSVTVNNHGDDSFSDPDSGTTSPIPLNRSLSSEFARRRSVTVSLTAYPNEDVTHINKTRNINVRAAFVHVIGDLVQSIGVLIAALIIKFNPEYKLADPICTFIFSVLVLITTITVMRDIVLVLMEGTPRDVDYNGVRKDLNLIDGVKAAHSLHMWSLTTDKAAMAVHLAIDPSVNALVVMQKANRMMRFKYNLTFTTVQVEPYDESVMSKCDDCVGPSV